MMPAKQETGGQELLDRIKEELPRLEELLEEAGSHWGYEDPIYRFYHQSYKVFHLQSLTRRIVEALASLLAERELNVWFREIVAAGLGKEFSAEMNARWTDETRPILEAFFHAKYFLAMVVKYGRELDSAPSLLPSGWASVLHLFGLR